MGDLRNKLRKQAERLTIEAMQRRLRPVSKPGPLPSCLCGHTWHQAQIWAVYPVSRLDPVGYYCAFCLPPDLLWLKDGR